MYLVANCVTKFCLYVMNLKESEPEGESKAQYDWK